MKQQVFKNLFSNYIGNFIGMGLGFLLVPFLIQKLGKDAYGIAILIESMILLFQVVAFSLRTSLARYATTALSSGNQENFVSYLGAGRSILIVSGILIMGLGVLGCFYFDKVFTVPDSIRYESKILALTTVVAFALSMPNMVYWSILYAKNRFDLINYANYGGIIVRAVLVFVIFNSVPARYVDLITYGVIYLIMTLAQNYIIYISACKSIPNMRIKPLWDRKAHAKEILAFGSYSTIAGVSGVLYESAMNILLNISYGPALNSLYAIANKIPSLLRRVFLTPTSSLNPTFTHLYSIGDKGRIKTLFLFYNKLMNLVILPICLCLIFISKTLIVAWVGKDFLEAGAVMPLFLLTIVFSVPAGVCNAINNAWGAIKIPAIVTLVSAIVNILIASYLTFYLKWGVQGIAISQAIISFLVFFIFMPLYACCLTQIKIREYWHETVLKPAALLLFILVLLGFSWNACKAITDAFYMYIILIMLAMAVYGYLAYRLVINANERSALIGIFRPWLEKVKVLKV